MFHFLTGWIEDYLAGGLFIVETDAEESAFEDEHVVDQKLLPQEPELGKCDRVHVAVVDKEHFDAQILEHLHNLGAVPHFFYLVKCCDRHAHHRLVDLVDVALWTTVFGLHFHYELSERFVRLIVQVKL